MRELRNLRSTLRRSAEPLYQEMRQFYRMFEIRDAARLESGSTKRDSARLVSGVEATRHIASVELSWSHYRLLMQVENPAALEWYMQEAAGQHWSTRQLERQISVPSEARQIFAAKYVKVLPTERDLTREMERGRRVIDACRGGEKR